MPGYSVVTDQAVQFGQTKFDEVRQRMKRGTEEPDRDERSGLFVYDVFVRTAPPRRGSYVPKPVIESVKILAREAPALTEGQPVVFVNLRAFVRVELGESGLESGLYYSADGIEGQAQKREVR